MEKIKSVNSEEKHVSCIQYRILPEHQLILTYLTGEVTLPVLIQHQKTLIADSEYCPNFSAILDLRRANLLISKMDIVEFREFVKATPGLLADRRISILAATPRQTALCLILILYFRNLPFKINVYNTLSYGLHWARLSKDKLELIDSIFNEMNS